jgi:hypothetical protein
MKRFKLRKHTVLDTKTGLEWEREHKIDLTWQEAMDYAAAKGKGWRLPTVEEQITLIDFSQSNPASDFPDMPSESFWSSSSYADSVPVAWFVNFYYGYVSLYNKSNAGYVRCVRGGLCPVTDN